MLNKKANPLLVKMEKAITAKVPPKQMPAFKKIILAGEKVLFSDKMHKLVMSQLKSPGNPAVIAGEGAAKLFGILITQTKGTIPMEAGSPASAVLLCEILDMMEQLGKIKVDNNNLAEAVQSMSSGILQLFGVTPEQLSAMMQEAQSKQQGQRPSPSAQPAPQGAQPLIGAPA